MLLLLLLLQEPAIYRLHEAVNHGGEVQLSGWALLWRLWAYFSEAV
jgi:hypothetical protein